jgi:oligoendopeptidase F
LILEGEKIMSDIKKRDEIEDKFKWCMEDVYANEDLWRDDIENVEKMLPELSKMQGRILESSDTFKYTIEIINNIELLVEKIYFYANQKYHEDLGNSKYQSFSDKATDLLTNFYAVSSFVEPELLSVSEDKIMSYIEENNMQDYKQYFRDLFRQKSHVLSAELEEILAQTQTFSGGSSDIFTIFNNVDLKFEPIKDENGKEVSLTHATFGLYMESKKRSVRESAFKSLYKSYGDFRHTLSTIYINNLKKDSFYANVRKYSSSRQMYLDENAIPESVYDNLVETVNDNIGLLHRYMSIRKKVMKIDDMHLYDVYVPMVDTVNKDIPYKSAVQMVLEGLKPMGSEYIGLLEEGFENNWIDVYENEGKKSGAYSWSVYGIHPYVLLNYQPNLNSVFTIAHEMGHALHSYYSNKNQTYSNAGYKIFVAEVASTCNEALLINHLIDNADDKKEKAYLINHFLEQFRTTLFRQTMFAEFENIVHGMVDNGEQVNCEIMCQKYYDLNCKYFGKDVIIDKEIEMEWARIPHFYSSFYVYQYATGFSAAVALAKKILNEGEKAVDDYKKFLKAGSSDYPIEILKWAGVDLSSKEPVEMAMKMFENLLDEFEKLMD